MPSTNAFQFPEESHISSRGFNVSAWLNVTKQFNNVRERSFHRLCLIIVSVGRRMNYGFLDRCTWTLDLHHKQNTRGTWIIVMYFYRCFGCENQLYVMCYYLYMRLDCVVADDDRVERFFLNKGKKRVASVIYFQNIVFKIYFSVKLHFRYYCVIPRYILITNCS